jgi:two-component system uhpT operon response regulator UhpA
VRKRDNRASVTFATLTLVGDTQQPEAERSRRVRVALVDDHRLVLDGLKARLEQEGEFEVPISAASWDELLEHPEFPVDVVVLDLFLEDRIPVPAKLHALASTGASSVVMSRHADPASITAAIRAGALAFVPKTETADELVAAIHAAADGRSYVPKPLAATLAAYVPPDDPKLGAQELRALMLYSRGESIREVADEMSTTEETVKSYIKRGRRKYRRVGVDLGTRALLRRHAVREGWLAPDQP